MTTASTCSKEATALLDAHILRFWKVTADLLSADYISYLQVLFYACLMTTSVMALHLYTVLFWIIISSLIIKNMQISNRITIISILVLVWIRHTGNEGKLYGIFPPASRQHRDFPTPHPYTFFYKDGLGNCGLYKLISRAHKLFSSFLTLFSVHIDCFTYQSV